MSKRFNPPPNWPAPPAGWTPPPGWRPDPSWGLPPPGWQLWVETGTGPPRPHPVASHEAAQASSSTGSVMVAVAAASCGFAAFVPPLWAASRRPHDARFRRRMYAVAAGLLGLLVGGVVLVAAAEEDATGTPVGPLGDLGGTLVLLSWIFGVTVAVLVRNTRPSAELPGLAAELARRNLRERYRQLATDDPDLARGLRVGRPDLPREVDDGGLVDLNTIPASVLGDFAGLSPAEATRVAEARERLGRFSSVEEVAVYADLSDAWVASVRDRALFI